MVVWGCNLMLEAKGEDNIITHSICVYDRPLFNQISNSLFAAQDNHILA